MYSLVNSNFNRTYNPSGRQNALSDIKRLLTSRDTDAQNKACGYVLDAVRRFSTSSYESSKLVEYLLDNDITVFLCEATSNLDFTLFRSVLSCIRSLWRSRRFFTEEHAAHAMTAVLRALAHYAGSGSYAAVDACLSLLCDLLNGISTYETTPPLSHQSAYSALQLLACLNALAPLINTNPNTILSSALVLHSLTSYQPSSLIINSNTATALVQVIKQWFSLLQGALNHATLVGDSGLSGMFLVVICEIGFDSLRLMKLLHHDKQKADFVQTILSDDQEIAMLKQCSLEFRDSIHHTLSDLVVFTKENQTQISTEEYGVFLKFLLCFLYENNRTEVLTDFCDLLFSKGYITMLPQVQIIRADPTIRKLSILVLGEMLKTLAEKYLNVDNEETDQAYARDIHTGLVELQYGIEKPQSIGAQLLKNQPYSLLIYIYFYCQSSENPEEATAPLLPYLVEHILNLPSTFAPPPYIVKALWLVFAMSTISNGSMKSLDERVYLEKATDRLIMMLQPDPSIYYTHNPAVLLWGFSSQRIPHHIRLKVLSQWLKTEDSLPKELTSEPIVWELLLNILIQSKHQETVTHCMEALHVCLDEGSSGDKEKLAASVWTSLPGVLSQTLINDDEIGTNVCHYLEFATTLLPHKLDEAESHKIAVLITTLYSKNKNNCAVVQSRFHYEYVCLKLSLYLLQLANDNRVLLTYINRAGFLSSVLTAASCADDRVACAALQLLSHVTYYFNKNNYQPNSILHMQTHLVIKSFRRNSSNERCEPLLRLVYTVLNSGRNTPLALSYELSDDPSAGQQCTALRALMFRIQLMLCCRNSEDQTLTGWKTLSSIFKNAIVAKNDPKLVATLSSQPWTHTLIKFQLTQGITEEFLTFVHHWITLLKITITSNQEQAKRQLSKLSLVIRTMMLLKRKLILEDDLKELKQKVLVTVKGILELSSVRFN